MRSPVPYILFAIWVLYVGACCSAVAEDWPRNWASEPANSSAACAEWVSVSSPFPGMECSMYRGNGSVVCREFDERGRKMYWQCKE